MKVIIAAAAFVAAMIVAPATTSAQETGVCVPVGMVVTDVATGNQYVYDIQSPEVINENGDQYIDASRATTGWYEDSCGNYIPEICVEWRPGQVSALFNPADPVWRAKCAEFAVAASAPEPPVAPPTTQPAPLPTVTTVPPATIRPAPVPVAAVPLLSWLDELQVILVANGGW